MNMTISTSATRVSRTQETHGPTLPSISFTPPAHSLVPPDTHVLSCHFHADNQATDLSPALTALQIMHLPPELLHLKVFQAPQTQCVQTYNLLPLPTLTPVGEALLTPVTRRIWVFIPHLPLPHCCLVNHRILLFSFIGFWNLSCVSFPIALILLQTILSFT